MKLIQLLILLSLTACPKPISPKTDRNNPPQYTIYVLGKPNMRFCKAKHNIAKSKGINIKYIFAGCIMTDKKTKEKKKIKASNKKAFNYYSKKFGKNWENELNFQAHQHISKTIH